MPKQFGDFVAGMAKSNGLFHFPQRFQWGKLFGAVAKSDENLRR